MKTFWAFIPFLAYIALVRAVSIEAAIWGALLFALLQLMRTVTQGRRPKIIELGNAVLFGGLILYGWLTGTQWTIGGQKMVVDLGLCAIVLFSIAIGQPFTLQYAREQVPEALWELPQFKRTNRLISAAWALAFALMAGIDLLLEKNLVTLPIFFGLHLVVLAGAGLFTWWLPTRSRTHLPAEHEGAPSA